MKQTKIQRFFDANINTWVGFSVSMLLSYFVLPLFGTQQKISTAFEITLIYTVVSVARNYLVRRIFNKGVTKNEG